jgi:pyruvate formate lyase activating enzyme
MSIKDVLDHVMEHSRKIRGITCSGGECTLYAEFMTDLFPVIRRQGLSCLIETNGTLDFEKHRDLLEHCNGVMLDIKAADPALHMELTGSGNAEVFRSALVLARMGKLTEVRTVVTGADYGARETVEKTARMLKSYLAKSDIRYRLIPFRVYGVRREYRNLGTPSRQFLEELRDVAVSGGFTRVLIS